jgi:hypothetical protein
MFNEVCHKARLNNGVTSMSKLLKSIAIICSMSCTHIAQSTSSLDDASRKFLGLPYGSSALIVNKDVMASSYDCMTYVETVLALQFATKNEPAHEVLNRIRYFDGKRDEALRKHFVETDWISDNQRLGFVKDITKDIMPSAPSISATIDKTAWFTKVHPELASAFENSTLTKKIDAKLDYIPLDSIPDVIRRIPDGAVVIFIQDDINKLEKYINTPLIVGHMGFVLKVNGQLTLRQADSGAKVINDMDFAKAMVASKRYFRGITVLEIQKK